MNSADATQPSRLTFTHWLILFVAALGFAFDIYELLMMPLIAGPALAELLDVPMGSPEIRTWGGYIFWASALSGGFFGLLGGYLTDRFGRRRVLVWSILLYAFSACAAAFSTSPMMLLVLRCTTFVGVCVEFVAAVAWLAELFPNPKQREAVLGYTQAFSSIGGLLVTGANVLAIEFAQHLPAIYGEHSHWRYTLLSGVIPAIPLILIRPFLPESPAWAKRAAAGTLKRPSFGELFQPAYRRVTIVTTILFACSYGAAFGAIQLTPTLIVPGLPEVQATRAELTRAQSDLRELEEQLAQTAGESPDRAALETDLQKRRAEVSALQKDAKQPANAVQFFQEMGGLTGRFLLAFLTVRMISRQFLLRIFQLPGLFIIPLVYWFPAQNNFELLKWGIFIAGLCTVAQFSFWGNYLPRVYPTHLRGTGEGFAANVGGRMLGTSAAFITTQVAEFMPGETSFQQLAYAAGAMALFVYGLGSIVAFWLPEPAGELPE